MKLVLFAHTPPPHHGQSYMVELLLQQFATQTVSDERSIEVLHVNARLSADVSEIGKGNWRKLARAVRYIAEAVGHRLRGARVFFYIPAPGLRAALYRDWLIIGSCRLLFPTRVYYWQAAGLSDWLCQEARPWERWLSNRLLRKPALSIVLGEFNRRDAEWAGSQRTVVIPNGIPDPCPKFEKTLEPVRRQRAHSRQQLWADERTGNATEERVYRLLFIGLCLREKGLFDAVEAVGNVNRKMAEIQSPLRARLEVAGSFFTEAERAEFDRRVAELELKDAVHYHGFVAKESKRQLFERCDCLIFPTYYLAESFGIVLIEAMAFGMQIVTTRWRSVPELLPAGYEGIVNPRDPVALAGAIERAMRSPYDPRLRERFLAQYTIEHHAGRVREALLGLTAGPSP